MRNNHCPKCFKETIRVRTINTGNYKSKSVVIDCTPLIGLTCFSCGWCGHVPFSFTTLKVIDFIYDEDAEIQPDNEWESISRLGRFKIGA